jgi:hypothetical protein
MQSQSSKTSLSVGWKGYGIKNKALHVLIYRRNWTNNLGHVSLIDRKNSYQPSFFSFLHCLALFSSSKSFLKIWVWGHTPKTLDATGLD